MKVAKKINCPRLCFLCERQIRKQLTIDDVFLILKKSHELGLGDILKLATAFSHQNWPQFCAHKGGMEIIGIELFQQITIEMQQFKADESMNTSPEALENVSCTVIKDFKAILLESEYADGDFLFPNPDVAEHIKFHRCIVAAHTKPLFQLISSNKSKQFILDGIPYFGVKDLLEYIYFGDVKFNPIGACKLIENAVNQFSLQHILDHCIHSISAGITNNYALDILRITYLSSFQMPAMKELRVSVLSHICKNFKSIDVPTIRSVQPPEIAYQMLADVLEIVYQYFPEGASLLLPPSKKISKPKKKHRKVSRTLSSSTCRREERPRTKRTVSVSKM